MLIFFLFIFIFSILAFIAFGADKRRTVYRGRGISLGLLIPASILGSFGALMGMLFFQTRLKSPLLLILSIGMTCLWGLFAWLLF